jgi:hypothetical protein
VFIRGHLQSNDIDENPWFEQYSETCVRSNGWRRASCPKQALERLGPHGARPLRAANGHKAQGAQSARRCVEGRWQDSRSVTVERTAVWLATHMAQGYRRGRYPGNPLQLAKSQTIERSLRVCAGVSHALMPVRATTLDRLTRLRGLARIGVRRRDSYKWALQRDHSPCMI